VQAVQTQAVSQERLAQMLGVSLSSIKRIWQRWRQTGSSQVLPHAGGKRPKLSSAQCEQVRQQVQADTDTTLQEVQRWLEATQIVRLSLSTLSRLLRKLNLPRKKESLHATERDTAANQQKREAWCTQVAALDPAHLIFVDESGVTRSMTRRYGRAPKGERVHGSVPLGHGEVATLIGALALDGVRASFSVEAATDSDVFPVFVEQVLRPALHPGDVVIWDNLSAHKAPELQAAIESAQATWLPLPPYSPDFNPIEQCWSKVKEFLRAAEARTSEALEQAIGKAFSRVTASDVRGWFQHCGYRLT
jgi:transposase